MPRVSLNSVQLIGNLTEDADVRMMRGNKPVTNLNMAVNESYKKRNGDWGETTTYIRVRAFRDYGQLRKGDLVLVSGKLYTNKWEQNGQSRQRLEVTAFKVNKIMSPGEGRSGGDRTYERDRSPDRSDDRSRRRPEPDGSQYDEDDIPF